MEHGDNILTWVGNTVSVGAIIGSIFGYVPVVAAIVALVWYVIQILESKTAQRWFRAHHQRKLASLRARLRKLEGSSLRALPPSDEG